MQDKSGLIRNRTASDQPYRTPDEIRSNAKHVQPPPSNTPGIHTSTNDLAEIDGPLVPITIQIPKQMKAEIQRIAAQDDKSDSCVARTFLGRGLQANIDMQYGAMLKPVIERAIHDNIQRYSDRIATINLQALYSAEQNRNLSIHNLRFITDLVDSPDELPVIIKASQELAWKSVTNLRRNKTATPATEEDDHEWQS